MSSYLMRQTQKKRKNEARRQEPAGQLRIEVREINGGKLVRTILCYDGERAAEVALRGVIRQMDGNRYFASLEGKP